MKIAVFVYSQSGQAEEAARRIFDACRQNREGDNVDTVVYKAIVPEQHYPFPWSSKDFFDTFPETRLGIPPSGIKQIDLSDVEDADIVAIVGQSWFLSPSLPLQSFFHDKQIRNFLSGRNIIFINVCRNMWLKTIERIKDYLNKLDALLVGHIVLQDRHPNLVSAATIVRWLIRGKKTASFILPSAGVSDDDLIKASRFGNIIQEAVQNRKYDNLQENLLSVGAIQYKPSIIHIEKIGYRMFGFWAKFIRRKGGFRDPRRSLRVRFFYIYLVIVLFFVSPFVQLFFYLTYPLRPIGKNKRMDCRV